MSASRRFRRSQNRPQRADGPSSFPGVESVDLQLVRLAGDSLKLNDDDYYRAFDVINQRPTDFSSGVADRLLARVVELAERVGVSQFLDRSVPELRAEIVERQGEDFLLKVAATHVPAMKAASQIIFAGGAL